MADVRLRPSVLAGALVTWLALAASPAPAQEGEPSTRDTAAAAQTAAARPDTVPASRDTVAGDAAGTAEAAGTARDARRSGDTQAVPVDTVYRVEPRPTPSGELSESLRQLRGALERVGWQAARAAAELALVVHDDYAVSVDQVVDGNLALVGGDLELEGTVRGDVLVFDGRLEVEPTALITGDLIQVGGEVERNGGDIRGEFLSMGFREGDDAAFRIRPPPTPSSPSVPEIDLDWDFWPDGYRGRGPFWGLWHGVWEGIGGLFTTFSFWLVLALLGWGWMHFAGESLEVTSETVQHSFGRSFLVGLAGLFLFLPAIIALAIGIITAVLIPFFILAYFLAHFMGYLAVAHAAGAAAGGRGPDWTSRLPWAGWRSRHMLTGLLLLLGLFAAGSLLQIFGGLFEPLVVLSFLAAIFVTWVAFTAGFGAVILSRVGTEREWALPGRGPAAGDRIEQAPGTPASDAPESDAPASDTPESASDAPDTGASPGTGGGSEADATPDTRDDEEPHG